MQCIGECHYGLEQRLLLAKLDARDPYIVNARHARKIHLAHPPPDSRFAHALTDAEYLDHERAS